jgi:undecaprenyl-diphosphatase
MPPMIPGTSRSAATIIGGMLLGASRTAAAEFSFFLAIPTMAAASAYSLLKYKAAMSKEEWIILGIGLVVSFFTAWGVIAFLMNYIRTRTFSVFGYYRIVLAIAVVVFFLFFHKG